MATSYITAVAAGPTPWLFMGGAGGVPAGQGSALLLNIPAGVTANVTVEVAGAIGNAAGPANAHDVLQGVTSSMNSSLAYPVGAFRLNLASYSSAVPGAAVTLTIITPPAYPGAA